MKSYSLQLLQIIGLCLVIILPACLAVLCTQLVWEVYEQLVASVNNFISRADDHILSFSK